MRTVFLTELEKEYSELIQTGKVRLVENVEKLTSKKFNSENPIYFRGNIRSRFALVTFNIKPENFCKKSCPTNFSDYQYEFQNLGRLFLKSEKIEEFQEKYSNDIRTMHYVSPFQVIRYDNLSEEEKIQRFIDEKFELELVPYTSPDFSVNDFLQNYSVCKTLLDRALSGVFLHPRQYVIFLGEYFKQILKDYIVDSERFSFLLTSCKKPNQKCVASFIRVTLNYNNTKIIAGIAESFYDENFDEVMLEKYGRESAAIINRGFLLSNPLWKTY